MRCGAFFEVRTRLLFTRNQRACRCLRADLHRRYTDTRLASLPAEVKQEVWSKRQMPAGRRDAVVTTINERYQGRFPLDKYLVGRIVSQVQKQLCDAVRAVSPLLTMQTDVLISAAYDLSAEAEYISSRGRVWGTPRTRAYAGELTRDELEKSDNVGLCKAVLKWLTRFVASPAIAKLVDAAQKMKAVIDRTKEQRARRRRRYQDDWLGKCYNDEGKAWEDNHRGKPYEAPDFPEDDPLPTLVSVSEAPSQKQNDYPVGMTLDEYWIILHENFSATQAEMLYEKRVAELVRSKQKRRGTSSNTAETY